MFRIFFTLSASLVLAYSQINPASKDSDTLRYVFEPDSLTLNIGETSTVTIKLVDA